MERERPLNLLVQELERHASAEPRPTQHGVRSVVLDVEIGDLRCILIRSSLRRLPQLVALSAREQQIARLVAAGESNKTIAVALDLSCWTVSTYLRRIYAKLRVTTRAAMVTQLHRHGLCGPAGVCLCSLADPL